MTGDKSLKREGDLHLSCQSPQEFLSTNISVAKKIPLGFSKTVCEKLKRIF